MGKWGTNISLFFDVLLPESGHFYALVATHRKPEYAARIYTTYRNTTGQCLQFAYLFLGNSDCYLSVRVIAENLTETNIRTGAGRKVRAVIYSSSTYYYNIIAL